MGDIETLCTECIVDEEKAIQALPVLLSRLTSDIAESDAEKIIETIENCLNTHSESFERECAKFESLFESIPYKYKQQLESYPNDPYIDILNGELIEP